MSSIKISNCSGFYFNITIKKHFWYVLQVTLYHVLKLYSNGPDSELSEKPVLSEFYEEIIFQDPSTYMKYILNDTLSKKSPIAEQNLHCMYLFF